MATMRAAREGLPEKGWAVGFLLDRELLMVVLCIVAKVTSHEITGRR